MTTPDRATLAARLFDGKGVNDQYLVTLRSMTRACSNSGDWIVFEFEEGGTPRRKRKDSARRLRIWSKHSPRPSLMPPTPDPSEVTR